MKNFIGTSRRGFLKGSLALAAAASLSNATGVFNELGHAAPASITDTETIFPGTSPSNCGGCCVTRIVVKNGVIKRHLTDERPEKNLIDGNEDNPQRRSCVRCRSKSLWYYRPERLKYPMIQTGERGDLSGFKRVSWETAIAYIVDKIDDLQKRGYGPRNFFSHNSTGDPNHFKNQNPVDRFLELLGGRVAYRSTYSFPIIEHASWFVLGPNKQGSAAFKRAFSASRQSFTQAEQIVCWSFNPMETVYGSNTMWYIMQARDMGAKLVTVDSYLSKTAAVSDQFISPVPGTDVAMMLAMLYHLLKSGKFSKEVSENNYEFLKTKLFGFFDEPKGEGFRAEGVSADEYYCPAGASLSAYIFGNDDFLVKKGLNKATSVYPDAIGYNVNGSADDPGGVDPLYGKKTPVYGQVPKTPEWAEKICGVPAKVIKELAESIASKKTILLQGGGWQRNHEGEQALMLSLILGLATGNFGRSGQGTGWPLNFNQTTAGVKSPKDYTVSNPLLSKVNIKNSEGYDVYDENVLTAPKYTVNDTRKSFMICSCGDYFENGGTGKSRYNDGQVKHLPEPKMIINGACNKFGNQTGDPAWFMKTVTDKSKIELIVALDFFMTHAAKHSDVILPVAMTFEKEAIHTPWNFGDEVLYMPEAIKKPGEVMSDFEVFRKIAKVMGKEKQYSNYKTEGQIVKDTWAENPSIYSRASYEELKESGILPLAEGDLRDKVALREYRNNPTSKNNMLLTPSGRIEAYSQALAEDYEARFHENIDGDLELVNGKDGKGNTVKAEIYTKKHGASSKARFVYPIPMYIPLIEGRHACDQEKNAPSYVQGKKVAGYTKHPDVTGRGKKGYNFTLHSYHMMYRSHSTLFNSVLLQDMYMRDEKGKLTNEDMFPKKALGNGIYDHSKDIIMPVIMNPEDIMAINLQEGDVVLISNDRGRIRASLRSSKRVNRGNIMISQGGITIFDKDPLKHKDAVDLGGNVNTTTSARPSRIAKGMALATDNRVKVEKFRG